MANLYHYSVRIIPCALSTNPYFFTFSVKVTSAKFWKIYSNVVYETEYSLMSYLARIPSTKPKLNPIDLSKRATLTRT